VRQLREGVGNDRVGQHDALTVDDQTDRYIRALANPTVDVLAHPRGRMYNHRRGLTARWDEVFGAAAEYGGQFRNDVAAFVSREVVDAAVVPGRHELPPVSSVRYAGFTDPSGGSADAMTLAVAHRDKDSVVVDALREVRPPFSPEGVVADFAKLLKSYRIGSVAGDRYAGEWPRERFREHGISYELADKVKSDYYRDFLAPLNSGKVELLDNKRLVSQLCQLERRTARGGRDSIDHPPGGHDDLANAVAGVAVRLLARPGMRRISDEAVAASARALLQAQSRPKVFFR